MLSKWISKSAGSYSSGSSKTAAALRFEGLGRFGAVTYAYGSSAGGGSPGSFLKSLFIRSNAARIRPGVERFMAKPYHGTATRIQTAHHRIPASKPSAFVGYREKGDHPHHTRHNDPYLAVLRNSGRAGSESASRVHPNYLRSRSGERYRHYRRHRLVYERQCRNSVALRLRPQASGPHRRHALGRTDASREPQRSEAKH